MNRVLRKIAKIVLLTPTLGRRLDKVCRFYEICRLEEGLGTFRRGYCSHPRINTPPGRIMNVEISEGNLTDIKRILDKEGLRYWLMFGTFLGAYRDKAILPYDGDTDLAIYSEDLFGLVRCQNTFVKEGFQLGIDPTMATLYRGGEHTDIYFFELDNGKRVWESIKYDASAFETFNEIQFLGQNWRILSEPERWLKYTYGEDWRTPIKGKGVKGYAYGEKFEVE